MKQEEPKIHLQQLHSNFNWESLNEEATFIQFSPHEFVPEGLPNDVQATPAPTLLIRHQATKYMNFIRQWYAEYTKYKRFSKQVRIFRGPTGVGKSSLLLQLVLFAKTTGWIVFYIPNTSKWATISETDDGYPLQCKQYLASVLQSKQTCELLQQTPVQLKYNIQCNSLYDVVVHGSENSADAPQILLSYILELQYTTSFPVIFALDEWDSLHSTSAITNRIAQKFLSPSTFSCVSCILLLATSGENISLKHFEDGDIMNYSAYISPYSEAETNTMQLYNKEMSSLSNM